MLQFSCRFASYHVIISQIAYRKNVNFDTALSKRANFDEIQFLGHLLRDDLINPAKMSVRPSVRTSTIKLNAATNQIVEFVRVDETFTTI